MNNIYINCHSSIKFNDKKVVYFDPYKIEDKINDADMIFITHDHYDHFDEESIYKIINDNTIIVVPENVTHKCLSMGINKDNIVSVLPNNTYNIDGITIETIPSYNIGKKFHPKENNWCGYIITLNNIRYYIAGDTDITNENKKVKCDVALVPIGGTYTMDYIKAAELVNIIKPNIVIPTHYACIVGSIEDGYKFKELLDDDIVCELLIK